MTSPNKREYIPEYRSGAYAILRTLYEANYRLNEQEIKSRGTPYSRTTFYPNRRAGEKFSAWDGIRTLKKHNLITESDKSPTYYGLTEEGIRVCKKMLIVHKDKEEKFLANGRKEEPYINRSQLSIELQQEQMLILQKALLNQPNVVQPKTPIQRKKPRLIDDLGSNPVQSTSRNLFPSTPSQNVVMNGTSPVIELGSQDDSQESDMIPDSILDEIEDIIQTSSGGKKRSSPSGSNEQNSKRRKYGDRKYKYIRGLVAKQRDALLGHSGPDRSFYDDIRKVISELGLKLEPVTTANQILKHMGFKGGLYSRLHKMMEAIERDDNIDDAPPAPCKYCASSSAILVALYLIKEQDKQEFASQIAIIVKAAQICEECFFPQPVLGNLLECNPWTAIHLLKSRGFVKSMKFGESKLWEITPSGIKYAKELMALNANPAAVNKPIAMYSNDDESDGLVLIFDVRENGGDSHRLMEVADLLKAYQIKYQSRAMKIGDYLLCTRMNGKLFVLPLIFERKRMDDLVASMKTGRLKRQLDNLNALKVYYPKLLIHLIIEGTPTRFRDSIYHAGLTENDIKAKIEELRSQYTVFETDALKDSVHSIYTACMNYKTLEKSQCLDELEKFESVVSTVCAKKSESQESLTQLDVQVIDSQDDIELETDSNVATLNTFTAPLLIDLPIMQSSQTVKSSQTNSQSNSPSSQSNTQSSQSNTPSSQSNTPSSQSSTPTKDFTKYFELVLSTNLQNGSLQLPTKQSPNTPTQVIELDPVQPKIVLHHRKCKLCQKWLKVTNEQFERHEDRCIKKHTSPKKECPGCKKQLLGKIEEVSKHLKECKSVFEID